MSAVDWVCKKISLESASEQLSAVTISRQQAISTQSSFAHSQTRKHWGPEWSTTASQEAWRMRKRYHVLLQKTAFA